MGGGQIGIHPTGLHEQGLYGRPPLLGGVAKDAEENTGAITRGVVELDGVLGWQGGVGEDLVDDDAVVGTGAGQAG